MLRRCAITGALLAMLLLAACGGTSADLPTALILPTLSATPTPQPTQTPTEIPTTPPTVESVPTRAPTATAVTIPIATLAPTLTPNTGRSQPALPPPTSNPAQPFAGSGLLRGQLLDFTVPVNLTALEAVDAVTLHALANTPAVIWTAVNGSDTTGWQVEFYDEDADTVVTYTVEAGGGIRRQIRAAFGLMPGFPLTRDLITVDSDRALARAAEDNSLPAGDITLSLRSAGDAPAWVVAGVDMIALVPATGQ